MIPSLCREFVARLRFRRMTQVGPVTCNSYNMQIGSNLEETLQVALIQINMSEGIYLHDRSQQTTHTYADTGWASQPHGQTCHLGVPPSTAFSLSALRT